MGISARGTDLVAARRRDVDEDAHQLGIADGVPVRGSSKEPAPASAIQRSRAIRRQAEVATDHADERCVIHRLAGSKRGFGIVPDDVAKLR